MPSLSTGSPFDEELKKSAVLGTLKILNLDPTYKSKYKSAMKKCQFTSMRNRGKYPFDPNKESAIAKTSTNWRQILPLEDNQKQNEDILKILRIALDASDNSLSRETKTSKQRKMYMLEQTTREPTGLVPLRSQNTNEVQQNQKAQIKTPLRVED